MRLEELRRFRPNAIELVIDRTNSDGLLERDHCNGAPVLQSTRPWSPPGII